MDAATCPKYGGKVCRPEAGALCECYPGEKPAAARSHRRTTVRRPFKGTWFYEWQVGPFVMQLRHRQPSDSGPRYPLVHVWLDPFWRAA